MAVHNLGYRGWAGELAATWSRFIVITFNGVRRAWTSKWLRRMLFMAWAPMLLFAAGVFTLERILKDMPDMQVSPAEVLETDAASNVTQPGSPEEGIGRVMTEQEMLVAQISRTPFAFLVTGLDLTSHQTIRHSFWSKLLQLFFRYPQGFLMIMLMGIIAPPLISQDVRSRAFLLYFSRPIDRWEYILGKAATIWVFLTLISTLPAFCLYLLGVLLSPSAGVVLATWDLPFRILLASAFLMIPTASLALCLSSMTQESRIAGFAWFAIWILGWFAFFLINLFQQAHEFSRQMQEAQAQQARMQEEQSFPGQMNPDGTITEATITPPEIPLLEEHAPLPPVSKWTYISLYDTLGVAQSWAFGKFDSESFKRARTAILVLIAITALSLTVLYRRVSAPMRA
jgi:ABC-2 type transport system permease protein